MKVSLLFLVPILFFNNGCSKKVVESPPQQESTTTIVFDASAAAITTLQDQYKTVEEKSCPKDFEQVVIQNDSVLKAAQ